jgi:hypothetical protein
VANLKLNAATNIVMPLRTFRASRHTDRHFAIPQKRESWKSAIAIAPSGSFTR